jgi:predicted metal-dependent phosphoesterase TrpH
MRCDLHVHSRHSGTLGLRLFGEAARESYSDPLEVHAAARARGMDLVTLTDHDSIDGALELRRRFADSFVSEEVTCRVPGGREVHIGVFGIDEVMHARIAGLRSDVEALFAYLAEHDVPACFNHPFSALTGPRETADLLTVFRGVTLVETRNGLMPESVNRSAELAARAARLAAAAGSDSHTLRSVARAYTEVPGARDVREFLEGLRRGLTIPRGRSGGYARLAGDVAALFASGSAEAARRASGGDAGALALLLLVPSLLTLVPIVTAALCVRDLAFARRQLRALIGPPRRGALRPQLSLGAGR